MSCEETNNDIEFTAEPSFTVTVSPDNSGIYTLENTTPGKDDFYSYFEIIEGSDIKKIADNSKTIEYEFLSSGVKTITLTMIGSTESLSVTKNISVILPPPSDDRFLFNPENLLANGYLAEGSGDDFTNWARNNGTDNMTAQPFDALIGFRVLKVNNAEAGDPWSTQFVSDPAPTTDGNKYTVSLWAKGASSNVIRFSTNPGVGGDQYAGDYTVTSDWEQYSWTFTANSATTIIALDMGTTAGSFLVDGIELVEGETALPLPSNDSALLNGGLEEGMGNDFTNWSKNNGEDRISEEDTNVLSGSRAMKVSNPEAGDPWSTQFVSDAFATIDGNKYIASLWIKGTAQIRYSTNPGVGGDQYAGDYTATSEWTKYSWTFTANSDTTLLALDMGVLQGTFVIDNIKVVAE